MARLLPADAAPPANPVAARLEALLATLPEDWLLIPDRRIGGEGGPRVGFVLLHPEIGIALVDVSPDSPEPAVRPLNALLAELGLERDTLPVVTVAIDPDELETIGERLEAAFGAMPPCGVEDRDWPERAAGVLLGAEDATMAPIRRPSPPVSEPEPEPHWLPRIEPDDAIEERPRTRRPMSRAVLAAGVVVITLAGLSLGVAIDLLTRTPPTPATASSDVRNPSATLPPPSAALSVPTTPPPAGPQPPVAAARREAAPPPPQTAAAPPPSTALPAVSPPPVIVPESKPALTTAPRSLEAETPPPSPVQHTAPPVAPKENAPPVLRAPASPAPAPATREAGTAPVSPAASEQKPPPVHEETKPVVARTPRKPLKKLASTEPDRQSGEGAAESQLRSVGGPPLDAADLPPLEDTLQPPPAPPKQVVNLPTGAPVPLPRPFGGPPAPGRPMSLLPPVAPPAAMPPPPALGGVVGTTGAGE